MRARKLKLRAIPSQLSSELFWHFKSMAMSSGSRKTGEFSKELDKARGGIFINGAALSSLHWLNLCINRLSPPPPSSPPICLPLLLLPCHQDRRSKKSWQGGRMIILMSKFKWGVKFSWCILNHYNLTFSHETWELTEVDKY